MATDTVSQSVVKDLRASTAPTPTPQPLTKISTIEKKVNKVQNIKSEEHIVRRPFSPKSEKYIRKLDRLVKIYEKMSEKNDRLRYHIVKVKEEVNKLSHIKRHLCCRLSSFNDNYMDENLEIPDTNNRDANFEKLIGEIITNAEPVGPPASKKRKVETKKVVVQKPKEVKEDSEEPEAREAINRILNDAKSLMRQQQQEQEEMVKSRMQDQKRQQQFQMQQLRKQRNNEKQGEVVESKPANDTGSKSAPIIQTTEQPSTSSIPLINAPSSKPLNRTMSNPTTQASKSSTNQQQKPTFTVNPPSSTQKYVKCATTASNIHAASNTQDSKSVIKSSLPLPQTPGVYILAPGQQLIKQPSHAQAEMIAKDMKQKQEEKNNSTFSAASTSVTPQKSSSQSYVVTHHDLPKNAPNKHDTHRQHSNQFQSYPSTDSQKGNAPQSQIFVRRLHPSENQINQPSVKIQQQQQHSTPLQQQPQQQQQQVPQIQIVTQAPKGPPLQAQISSQPLPNGSHPASNNLHPPIPRLRQGDGNQSSDNLQSQQPHPIQMEQVKLFYTQRQLQDPSTINPQLLPHRQLNAQRLHMEQQMKEREKQKKLEEEMTKDGSNLQHQNSQQQKPMQPIVIQSSNVQQIHQLQSQPRLREALQNAGSDQQQQIQLVQTIPASTVNTPGTQRIITTKQSPSKAVLQPKQNLPQQPQQNNVYFIDSSRCIRLASREQLVGVQPFAVQGNQAIRYYLPQNISTQAITVTSSPQKQQQQQTKVDDGKFDRLLRASSIDHLLPDNPDHDSKNDDNIDWSIYEEPKPSKSTPRKAPTPRKRGAAIKVDSNSDAMARISPILAKFQQEMAQSTVAQEQQHQQELTMAARNATKQAPVRSRKRPTKAEKEAAAAAKLAQNNQNPSSSSSTSDPSSLNNSFSSSSQGNNLQVPNTVETVVDNVKIPPSIIVTAATPDPSQANRQNSTTVDVANVQIQPISQNIRSQ